MPLKRALRPAIYLLAALIVKRSIKRGLGGGARRALQKRAVDLLQAERDAAHEDGVGSKRRQLDAKARRELLHGGVGERVMSGVSIQGATIASFPPMTRWAD